MQFFRRIRFAKDNGLAQKDIMNYWSIRSNEQRDRTVGFVGNSLSEQEVEYEEKIKFVTTHIDTTKRTIDYGCGIGRWSDTFIDYLGVDVTEKLLTAAKTRSQKRFHLLAQPYFEESDLLVLRQDLNEMEYFFTSTVLQHCNDKSVKLIFKSLNGIRKHGFRFVFYENSSVQAEHVKGRKTSDYVRLIRKFWEVKDYQSFTHIVHGEEHSLSIISV